jgi:hypothetical protein
VVVAVCPEQCTGEPRRATTLSVIVMLQFSALSRCVVGEGAVLYTYFSFPFE